MNRKLLTLCGICFVVIFVIVIANQIGYEGFGGGGGGGGRGGGGRVGGGFSRGGWGGHGWRGRGLGWEAGRRAYYSGNYYGGGGGGTGYYGYLPWLYWMNAPTYPPDSGPVVEVIPNPNYYYPEKFYSYPYYSG
jgi:hypothetical protein